jgi:hypothetical protein
LLSEVDGRPVVVTVGGPPGRQVHVMDAYTGEFLALYGLGPWRGRQHPFTVVRIGDQTRLILGMFTGDSYMDPGGTYFVGQRDLVSGAPIGPDLGEGTAQLVYIDSYLLGGRRMVVVVTEDIEVSQFDPVTGLAMRPVLKNPQTWAEYGATADHPVTGQHLLAVGSHYGRVTVWDLAAARLLWTDAGIGMGLCDLSLGGPAEAFTLGVARHEVEFPDALTGQTNGTPVPLDHGEVPRAAMWRLDGRATVFVYEEGRLRHLDVGSGTEVWPALLWDDEVFHLLPAVLDGREILFVGNDTGVCRVDALTGEPLP